ncbi:putative glutaredoxin.1 [Meiothermus luteus]|uniref:Putative glutaredoxin.1 n=1 Tax=Meiothermus luteus TaxID=2026184 RepID=A0A399EKF8_9DEIN|nr:glutaredoxin family protein [Meiothermus luteus]RIH82641.1 putative glutaredoxin.1 [Meiothermus luteus]RMH57212.1 MAG: glutaredoxin family protein [Deinococcota bacterium]
MIVVYSTAWCPDCRAAKRALLELGLPFTEVDIERNSEAAELVMRLNNGKRSVPTLVYGPHAVSLSRFSVAKLKGWLEQVGLHAQSPT